MGLTKEQITSVKGRGFLQNRGTECFSGRIVTVGGQLTPDALRTIAECAETFGNGMVIFTSRLSAEIQGIPFEKIPAAEQFVEAHGLSFGGTGAKIRPVTACKGTTCIYGNIDTQGLAQVIHDKFYVGMGSVKLPHKFKIAVGGCPNNCVKPDLNDLGIIGQRVPKIDFDACRGCGKCQIEAACPVKNCKVEDGKIVHDAEGCNNCGRCIGKCPFGVFTEETVGYNVYVGGRWGKRWARGLTLGKIFTTEEEVLNVVEKAILFFKEQGVAGERFSDTIQRIGFENVEKELLADDILARKEDILAK